MKRKKLRMMVELLSPVLAVALIFFGGNTLDQMMIRYKYYEYWRTVNFWEMAWFWRPNWWFIFVLSMVSLVVGGMFLHRTLLMVLKGADEHAASG